MDMLWSGWGDPDKAAPLPESVIGLLRDLLGVTPRETGPARLDGIAVPPSPLADGTLRALAECLGGGAFVRTGAESRIRRRHRPPARRTRSTRCSGWPPARAS
ncbi:FAD-binding oxidoreductase, partial [Streptomyces sp. NPDC029004]